MPPPPPRFVLTRAEFWFNGQKSKNTGSPCWDKPVVPRGTYRGGRETQCCGAKKAVEQVGAAYCFLSFQGVCWRVWFLMVALRALQLHPTGKITVCSDSEHVAGDAGCSKTMKDSYATHVAHISHPPPPQNMTIQSNSPAHTPEHKSAWHYSHTNTSLPLRTLPAASTTPQTTFAVGLGTAKTMVPNKGPKVRKHGVAVLGQARVGTGGGGA